MTKAVAIINQKGGVGKSTTALELGAGLLLRGYRVLFVDLDAQGNLSYTLGASTKGYNALGVLQQPETASAEIQHTGQGDIIASSPALAGADTLITETGKEYRLREALEAVRGRYDFVVIDTPPHLGILTVNALAACDSVIIPARADIYSLQGIDQLSETMKPVKKYCNPALTVEGILLTQYSPRSIVSREVAELAEIMAGKLGAKLFKTTIREAVAVREAQISQRSLTSYAPKSKVAEDYSRFVEELLEGWGNV